MKWRIIIIFVKNVKKGVGSKLYEKSRNGGGDRPFFFLNGYAYLLMLDAQLNNKKTQRENLNLK